jgi:phage gpG-like protein
LRYPYVKHLFYTEELEKYEVLFKHIVDVKKRFFETTLLDNLHLSSARFDYLNLSSAVTIRCAPYNSVKTRFTPFKVSKYIAAVDSDNKYAGRPEWKNFKYAARGQDEQNNAMTRFENYSSRDTSQVQQPQPLEQGSAEEQDVEDPDEHTQTVQNTIESIQRWKANIAGQDLQTSESLQGKIQLEYGASNGTLLFLLECLHSCCPSWST